MGKVIRLPHDPHRDTQLLLPWYAAGRLDAADRTRVEAHLSGCARCRAELASEHRLGAEVAGLPMDADIGWASMLRRIEDDNESPSPRRSVGAVMAASAPWVGWAAAVCVTLVLAGQALTPPPSPSATYHTLSAPAPAAPAGDVIVVFRPDATEAAISRALSASHARIVDGPTGADAYVLRVPRPERDAAVARLQAQQSVAMAEPIDMAGAP